MAKEKKDPIGEVYLKNVRLSFAALFEKGKPIKDEKTGAVSEPKYKANFLIPKSSNHDYDPDTHPQNMTKLKTAAEQVKADKWGKNIPKLKPDRVCVRDGDLEDWEGYESTYYVSANNGNQPVMVDRTKDANGKWNELTKENGGPRKLYSGAWVNAIVRIWAQDDPKYGKRLNASVESVQFLKHGDAFAAGKPVDPNEKFDDIDEEEADDLVDSGGDGDDLI